MTTADLDAFYAGHPLARAVHDRVAAMIDSIGPAELRVSKSQVAFRRRRGFAYLWLPDRYLARADAEVVLSIALPDRIASSRWKEVVRPVPTTWMHHLEVHSIEELDAEVLGWLTLAFSATGPIPGEGRAR